jgi:hypothetical protein
MASRAWGTLIWLLFLLLIIALSFILCGGKPIAFRLENDVFFFP